MPISPGERYEVLPNAFLHNKVIAAAALPALAVIVIMGGLPAALTLAVGVILTYTLDIAQTQVSLVVWWLLQLALLLCCVVVGAFHLDITLWNIFLLGNVLLLHFCLGIWGSLQYRFVQEESPALVVFLERLLFGVLPLPSAVLVTFALAADVGIDYAPFFLLAALLLLQRLLHGRPLPSSYILPKPGTSGGTPIVQAFESRALVMAVLLLPAAMFIAVHHRGLLYDANLRRVFELLVSGSALSVTNMAYTGSLWWLSPSGRSKAEEAVKSRVVTWLALLGAIGAIDGVQHRVLLYGFSQYFAVLPPWDEILLSLCLYAALIGTWLLARSSAAGAAGKSKPAASSASLLSDPAVLSFAVSAIAAGLLIGLPPLLLPMVAWAAAQAVSFVRSHTLTQYATALVLVLAAVTWLAQHLFWFLDFRFAVFPMRIQPLVVLLLSMCALALLVPGLVILRVEGSTLAAVLLSHAVCFGFVEFLLYEETALRGWNDYPAYPGWMVFLTSLVGLTFTLRLEEERRLPGAAAWLLYCVHVAKLSLLLQPPYGWLPAALVMMSYSAPFYFHNHVRLNVTQGMFHFVSMGISAFITRRALIGNIVWLAAGRPPTESMMIALFALLWAMGAALLVNVHFRHVLLLRRLSIFMLTSALLLAVIQPQLAAVEARGVAALPAGSTAAPWFLYAGMLLAVASLVNILPSRALVARTVVSAICGVCLAVYTCFTFLPELTVALLALHVAIFAAGASAVSLVLSSTPRALRALPWLVALLIALAPVVYVADLLALEYVPHAGGADPLETAHLLLFTLYAMLGILIAFALKLRRPRLEAAAGGRQLSALARRVGPQRDRLAQLHTLASITNLCVIVGLSSALHVSHAYLESGDLEVLALAPLLLLLQLPDGTNRYLPLVAALAAYLSAVSVARAVSSSGSLFAAGKNIGLLLLCLPSQLQFIAQLVSRQQRSISSVLALAPLNLLPLLLADQLTTRLLACWGFVTAGLQLWLSRVVRREGMRTI